MSICTRLMFLVLLATVLPATLIGLRFFQDRSENVELAKHHLGAAANSLALRIASSIQGTEVAHWPPAIKVAVNLSPVQFKSRGLLESVLGALAAGPLSPERLELEITESVELEVGDTTEATLHELRSLGIRIALDDSEQVIPA